MQCSFEGGFASWTSPRPVKHRRPSCLASQSYDNTYNTPFKATFVPSILHHIWFGYLDHSKGAGTATQAVLYFHLTAHEAHLIRLFQHCIAGASTIWICPRALALQTLRWSTMPTGCSRCMRATCPMPSACTPGKCGGVNPRGRERGRVCQEAARQVGSTPPARCAQSETSTPCR